MSTKGADLFNEGHTEKNITTNTDNNNNCT